MIGETWVGEGESEGESVDSEGEDSLQHAGVYTAEEVSVFTSTIVQCTLYIRAGRFLVILGILILYE